MNRLYLDHAATSPLRPAAAAAMARWDGVAANPASRHAEGRAARRACEEARAQVAEGLGVRAEDVVFTSGATEANNLAIRGACSARASGAVRVATTPFEHASSARACDVLARQGWEVSYLALDADGRVSREGLEAGLGGGTALVSVIAGHNEIGVVQPLAAIAEAAHAVGALVHFDAVQCAAYEDFADLPWDLLSLSSHKLGGPAGIGALVRRRGLALAPLIVGGAQEGGLRPGTLPTALAVGFGCAAELAFARRGAEAERLAALRDMLAGALRARFPDVVEFGTGGARLPHVLALGVPGVAGDELVHALDRAGIAGSSASACLAGAPSASLAALGRGEDLGLLRLSLGWDTRREALEAALPVLLEAIAAVRAQPPFERRRGPFAARAEEAGLALTAQHWALAEAVDGFYRREGILPGPRWLARSAAGAAEVSGLYPGGLAQLAGWLELPVPRGGCRPTAS